MPHRYFDLAFTAAVRSEQECHDSRAAYVTAPGGESGVDVISARERTFITSCDTFFLASVSETGWPYVQHRGGPQGFVRMLGEAIIG